MKTPFLFVALDMPWNPLCDFLDRCAKIDLDFGYKLNLDYFLMNEPGEGAAAIDLTYQAQVHDAYLSIRRERPVFADLKMWNGARTMVEIAKRLVDQEVDYFNVYALADAEIEPVIEAVKGSKTKVLGVTVLTHYDEGYCQKHFKRSMWGTVRHLAETASVRGCHGVILPGTMLDTCDETFGLKALDLLKVVPGIRPSWYSDKRHAEEVTPTYAREHGADIVVCGSPITKASDPIEALKKVLEELNGGAGCRS